MRCLIRACTALLSLSLAGPAIAADSLEAGFVHPPDSAKPYTWWHWMNGSVSKEGITKDLEAMKAVGLGGFQHFDVGLGVPGSVEYNSPAFHELMAFALAEANRLGLDAGFHNGSGWSSTGGPWITPENSMKQLLWSETTVRGGHDQSLTLAMPKFYVDPAAKSKEKPKQQKEEKQIEFYRDLIVLAFPTPQQRDYRLENWADKSLSVKKPLPDLFVPDRRKAPAEAVIAANDSIDVTKYLDPQGQLAWMPPAGEWTVVRIGYAANGVTNRPASKGGIGLEVDKLSRKATDAHWERLINKVIADAQGLPALTNVLVDSYEVGNQNWTEDFAQEFAQRRGYDLRAHLLCVTGRIVDSTESTERVLWDLRKTVAELTEQNYFAYFAEKCHAHGLKFAVEPYGSGSFDASSVTMLGDLPMTEFWQNSMRNLWTWTSQIVPGTAHLAGLPIVGAESFTAMDANWQEHPYTLKKMGDWAFCQGVNRYYFHTFAHQPWHDAVKPGMTMGRFGGNFHRNNTWYMKSQAWMEYIARCQYIFQSGTFQADILALYGDERAFNNFLGEVEPPDMQDVPGLRFDLGSMASLNDLSVDAQGVIRVTRQGKQLATGYKLLLIKRGDLMTPENVAKLGALAEQGAKIYAKKPLRSPSWHEAAANDQALQKLVEKYWDGKLIHDADEYSAAVAALIPDCVLPADMLFSHHRSGSDDYYFVANQMEQTRTVAATFRVAGKQPEVWNPMNGERGLATNWRALPDGRCEVTLPMTPLDAQFVIFRTPTTSTGTTTPPRMAKEIQQLARWTITFDPQWGPQAPLVTDTLSSWHESAVKEIKYFSGSATYTTTFELTDAQPGHQLDLGQVAVMAQVTLNGMNFGTLWKPPFVVDISHAAKVGANQLAIEVTNLWVNRLIGDASLPKANQRLPEWLTAGQAPPAGTPQRSWTAFEYCKKTDPLVPSGLLGPVRILRSLPLP